MTIHLLLPFIALLVAGYATGILSAVFGLGGGLTVVPVLYVFFTMQGVADAKIMHLAIGTSLAAMVATSLRSIYAHYRMRNIKPDLVKKFLPWVALGAVIGAGSSRWMHSEWLRWLFIAFLVLTIVSSLCKRDFVRVYQLEDFKLPRLWVRSILFTFFGMLSVWLGMGGSALVLPVLRQYRMPMSQATALALSLTPAVAILGTAGYIWAGMHTTMLPSHTLGYVSIPALVAIIAGTLTGVPMGARIASKLTDSVLAKAYVLLLVLILLTMLF